MNTDITLGFQQYSGFWRRLFAELLDIMVLALGWLILTFVLWGLQYIVQLLHFKEALASILCGTLFCLYLVAILFYRPFFESSIWQATPGKLALGIIVTDMSGQRISFVHAVGRFIAYNLTAGLILPCLTIVFTKKKQALHDLIAQTLVLKKQP